MSTSENEPDVDISDEQLPEDLQPGEDNPLATETPDERVDDLLTGGKSDESEDSED